MAKTQRNILCWQKLHSKLVSLLWVHALTPFERHETCCKSGLFRRKTEETRARSRKRIQQQVLMFILECWGTSYNQKMPRSDHQFSNFGLIKPWYVSTYTPSWTIFRYFGYCLNTIDHDMHRSTYFHYPVLVNKWYSTTSKVWSSIPYIFGEVGLQTFDVVLLHDIAQVGH